MPLAFERKRNHTHLLWVPRKDLSRLRAAEATQIRLAWRPNPISQMTYPTALFVYNADSGLTPDGSPMLLEKAWTEPWGAITGDDLRRCGFASINELKIWWIETYGKRARPMDTVRIYNVLPWNAATKTAAAESLLRQLYGHLPNYTL